MAKTFFRRLTKKFFIITNFILAVLFLLGCYAGYLDPKNWWFLGLLTLVSFYLLILLLGFIVFWLIARSRWALLPLISIALAFKPLTNIIPFGSRHRSQKKKARTCVS
jgi:hypothetical protein